MRMDLSIRNKIEKGNIRNGIIKRRKGCLKKWDFRVTLNNHTLRSHHHYHLFYLSCFYVSLLLLLSPFKNDYQKFCVRCKGCRDETGRLEARLVGSLTQSYHFLIAIIIIIIITIIQEILDLNLKKSMLCVHFVVSLTSTHVRMIR